MKKIISILIVSIFLLNFVNFAVAFQTKIKDSETENEEKFFYQNKFAVIIVGTYGSENQESITGTTREKYYFYFTGSAMRRFNILNNTYGFPKENIFILLTEVNEQGYQAHDTYNSDEFVNFWNSTTKNITMVFEDILPNLVTKDDILTVDLIGHGNDDNSISIPFYTKRTGKEYDRNKGIEASDTYMPLENPEEESIRDKIKSNCNRFSLKHIVNKLFPKFYLNNESTGDYRLYDHELSKLSLKINAKRVVFILQPCHSGGFINDLSADNHIIITACDEGERAGDFLGRFNDGLEGSADIAPEDGRISISEAFIFGSNNRQEYYPDIYPLLDDNADKKGSIDLEGEDGDVSSNIYDFSYEII